jgi:hypothetical protein
LLCSGVMVCRNTHHWRQNTSKNSGKAAQMAFFYNCNGTKSSETLFLRRSQLAGGILPWNRDQGWTLHETISSCNYRRAEPTISSFLLSRCAGFFVFTLAQKISILTAS